MNLDKLEDQVRALLDQNQKIEAIKLAHQVRGWGLKESKDYVDSLELKERRRKRTKMQSASRFQIGDSVVVKSSEITWFGSPTANQRSKRWKKL